MSELAPLKLYGEIWLPNPFKVIIVLALLDLPYETENIPFQNVKDPSYVAINPNGRLPALIDPNNGGFTIWESGAIIEYLVERYDKGNKLSFEAGSNDFYLAKQWLHFQMSGQGPYFGQATWFSRYHPEKLPSAVERYQKEILRVCGVLNAWLEKVEGEWLVGNKMSYADLAFIPWQLYVQKLVGEDVDVAAKFPHLHSWFQRMTENPTVAKLIASKPPL